LWWKNLSGLSVSTQKTSFFSAIKLPWDLPPRAINFKKEMVKRQRGPIGFLKKTPTAHTHQSLKISYPDNQDIQAAALAKMSPGGDIMIHGLPKSYAYLGWAHTLYDWTLGCIALTNAEIEKIYQAVDIGTIVEILP